MEWFFIIQLIIQIISAISEMLGGGLFGGTLIPNQQPVVHLAQYEWSCQSPYWSEAPVVSSNHFTGTVEMNCDVKSVSGGGIIELRKHLVSQIPQSVSEVKSGPNVENYEGLPSNAYEVAIEIDGDERVAMQGITHIATNGFTQFRSVFESTAIPTSGTASYLKSVHDEIQVAPAQNEGWYSVKMVYKSRVEKPWGVSRSKFQRQLKQAQEDRLVNRRERVLNDLAAHL
jgi:hypothetical protein